MAASAAAPADGRVEKRRLRLDVLRPRSSVSCTLARLRSPLYCYRVSRESEVAAPDTTIHRGRARHQKAALAHRKPRRAWLAVALERADAVRSRNAIGAIHRVAFRPCDP
jgi:hypothetical protein